MSALPIHLAAAGTLAISVYLIPRPFGNPRINGLLGNILEFAVAFQASAQGVQSLFQGIAPENVLSLASRLIHMQKHAVNHPSSFQETDIPAEQNPVFRGTDSSQLLIVPRRIIQAIDSQKAQAPYKLAEVNVRHKGGGAQRRTRQS